ncbi:MAG: hypothetical protein ACO3K7_05740, partial [Candidatus Marinamargulisbacteria bacterium]
MEKTSFSSNMFSCFLETQKLLNKDSEAFHSTDIMPMESEFIRVFSTIFSQCKQHGISWKVFGTGSYFLSIFMEKKINITDIDTIIMVNPKDYKLLCWQLLQFQGVSINNSIYGDQCTFRFLFLDIVLKQNTMIDPENQALIPYTLPIIDLTEYIPEICQLKPPLLKSKFKNILSNYHLITEPLKLLNQSKYNLVRIIKVMNFLDNNTQKSNLIHQLLLDDNRFILKKELDLLKSNKNEIKEKSLKKLGKSSSRIMQFNACLNVFLTFDEKLWLKKLHAIFSISPVNHTKQRINTTRDQQKSHGQLSGVFSKENTIITKKKYKLNYNEGHYLAHYDGYVNSDGYPHGRGEAIIAEKKDMLLSGSFINGKPIGVFTLSDKKKSMIIHFQYTNDWMIDTSFVSTINFFESRSFKGLITHHFLPKSGHLEYQNGDSFDGDFQDGLPYSGVKKYKNGWIFK